MNAGRRPSRRFVAACIAALAWCVAGIAVAQTAPSAGVAKAAVGLDTLKGTWIRPDGGYRIVVRTVGSDGRIDATYYNPNTLPFARAQATLEGGQLRAAFELRAGGYDGSTYDLVYDAASDRLQGVYYQAVVKQKFDVYFVRR